MARQNLQHQLKSELYRQFYDSKKETRHERKIRTGEYAHHDRIYSRNSLKLHLSRSKQFVDWAKENRPEIRNLSDITRQVAGEYLQNQKELGYSIRTIEADMTLLNHLGIGSNHWSKDQQLTKKEFNLGKRSKAAVTNNRGEKTPSTRPLSERQQHAIEFGKAFGLRRSELVPNKQNDRYAVTSGSLYEKDGRIYLATIGKGGRFRTTESLRDSEEYLRQEYGRFIQKVDELPSKETYIADYNRSEQLFQSIDNNVRVHVLCRQYYANEKLNEIEQDNRRFALKPQNQLKSGLDTYTTNGREMSREHAQFLSEQLGHNRIYELSSYINLK